MVALDSGVHRNTCGGDRGQLASSPETGCGRGWGVDSIILAGEPTRAPATMASAGACAGGA
jgi:hypothetical protein